MKRLISILILCLLLVGTTGCNLPTIPTELPPTIAPILPSETPAPIIANTGPPTETASVEPAPTETAPPEIIHVLWPKFGDGKAQTIHDQVSNNSAPEKRAYGGDEYALGRYERPFTSEEMEYLPAIDLVRADLYRDDDDVWAYATLEIFTSPFMAKDYTPYYGLELDADLDGRGDFLIIAQKPESDDWTTSGVQIWADINQNIGAKQPMKPDQSDAGDGYEMLIFDEGIGEDADAAWVRLSSESDNKIEIAFKLDLVDIGKEYFFFLWGAWSFADEVHPEWFDHHDHFDLTEAGSSLKDNSAYPLKAFAKADNTCRALSGMEPTGQLPGMCPYVPPPSPGKPSNTSSCTPINCCSSLTIACSLYWNPETCQCEPFN